MINQNLTIGPWPCANANRRHVKRVGDRSTDDRRDALDDDCEGTSILKC